ncbi:hypothetical protein HK097_003512 [Rhizophlyctis rosea]|uniref:Uncharacterized protein n=1 Tax=Rhizophlyctis rosea TaxID=64517 RepID=A0AAD5X3T8_9FUNG|nr:hypothetical protein HK097_003512 [Rhizophlyctis rosea]
MAILLNGLEVNADKPVAIQILRFFSEFVHNATNRMAFEVSSVNGILLFRETSKVLTIYGRHVLSRPVDGSRMWQEKYKGIAICINILKNSINGKYVNFGVYELYSDPTLNNARVIFNELILNIPLKDLMAHPKLTIAFFQLLESFTGDQLFFLKEIPLDAYEYVIRACAEGVGAPQENVSSLACTTIDQIASFVIRQSLLNKPTTHLLLQRASELPQLFTLVISRILETALFEDNTHNWSLTRPLLPLVLINREFWDFYIGTLVNGQLDGWKEAVGTALRKIMDGIEVNILPANKDRFTQQFLSFRREMAQNQITLMFPPDLRAAVNCLG